MSEWIPVSQPPKTACGVLLYVPMEHDAEIPHGQCYCIQVAFYDPGEKPAPGFYEQGTGHDYHERKLPFGDGNEPTHWQLLPDRPK